MMMTAPVAGLSFEEALAELEQIVRRLESGEGKLDESVTAYERGAVLRQHCEAKLREAQMRIERVTIADGTISGTAPLDVA